MESEPLMPCPICRAPTVLNPPNSPDVQWPMCSDDECPYILDGGDPERVAEQHNTLARRAEVGRIIESLMAKPDREATIFHRRGAKFVAVSVGEGLTGGPDKSHSVYSDTLLDALRSLAKEVSDVD